MRWMNATWSTPLIVSSTLLISACSTEPLRPVEIQDWAPVSEIRLEPCDPLPLAETGRIEELRDLLIRVAGSHTECAEKLRALIDEVRARQN